MIRIARVSSPDFGLYGLVGQFQLFQLGGEIFHKACIDLIRRGGQNIGKIDFQHGNLPAGILLAPAQILEGRIRDRGSGTAGTDSLLQGTMAQGFRNLKCGPIHVILRLTGRRQVIQVGFQDHPHQPAAPGLVATPHIHGEQRGQGRLIVVGCGHKISHSVLSHTAQAHQENCARVRFTQAQHEFPVGRIEQGQGFGIATGYDQGGEYFRLKQQFTQEKTGFRKAGLGLLELSGGVGKVPLHGQQLDEIEPDHSDKGHIGRQPGMRDDFDCGY